MSHVASPPRVEPDDSPDQHQRRFGVKRVLGGAVAGTLLVAAITAGEPQADTATVGGRIAFSRVLPDGGSKPYTVNPDGGEEQAVETPYVNEDFGRAVWSHDGQQLLLSNLLRFDHGELLPFRPATVRPDGSLFNLLELPQFPFDMYCTAWSPDDQRILCAVGGDSAGMWSLGAADGSDPVRITTNPYRLQDNPVGYSPDGSRIAFLRFKPGHAPGRVEGIDEKVALFVINADGTGLRQVTPYGLLLPHELASAAWAPDGAHLLAATRNGRLVEMRANGRGMHRILLDIAPGDYFAFSPSYSADGTRIVFSLAASAAPHVYTADLNGSNVVPVTDGETPELFPSWTGQTVTAN